jgi:cell division protein FtsB
MDDNAVLQAKAMMDALAQQRNQTADMVVQLVGENAVLRAQVEKLTAQVQSLTKSASGPADTY